MIIRRYLLWARTACAADRADGVSALARAYLHAGLSDGDLGDAETAMVATLDDPSPLVRRALADAIAGSPKAPHHLILALASDQREIAALVLRRSPVLSDAELVDCAAMGCVVTRSAIAARPSLSAGVAAALVEIGEQETVTALVANAGATLTERVQMRIIERYGSHGGLREALLRRRDITVPARQAIAVAASEALTAYSVSLGWMQAERGARLAREANERSALAIAASGEETDPHEVGELVEYLIEHGQLTPALILRAVLSHAGRFVEMSLSALSGLEPARVAALLGDRRSSGFAALYRRSGLPEAMQPIFAEAFALLGDMARDAGHRVPQHGVLDPALVRQTLRRCEMLGLAGAAMTWLRRLDTEASREAAVQLASRMADEAALATLLDVAPDLLLPPEAFEPVASHEPSDDSDLGLGSLDFAVTADRFDSQASDPAPAVERPVRAA